MFDLCFVPLPPPHHHSGKYNGTRSGCDVCIKDPLSGRCYTCRPLISWHNNICPLMFDIHSSDWKRYTVPNLTSEYVWWLSWNWPGPCFSYSTTNIFLNQPLTDRWVNEPMFPNWSSLVFFTYISSFYLKDEMWVWREPSCPSLSLWYAKDRSKLVLKDIDVTPWCDAGKENLIKKIPTSPHVLSVCTTAFRFQKEREIDPRLY